MVIRRRGAGDGELHVFFVLEPGNTDAATNEANGGFVGTREVVVCGVGEKEEGIAELGTFVVRR